MVNIQRTDRHYLIPGIRTKSGHVKRAFHHHTSGTSRSQKPCRQVCQADPSPVTPSTFLGSMLNFFLPIAIFRFRCKVLLQGQRERGWGCQCLGIPGPGLVTPKFPTTALTCPHWLPDPPPRSSLHCAPRAGAGSPPAAPASAAGCSPAPSAPLGSGRGALGVKGWTSVLGTGSLSGELQGWGGGMTPRFRGRMKMRVGPPMAARKRDWGSELFRSGEEWAGSLNCWFITWKGG